MPRFELLVGSEAFWERAEQDILRAKDRVLVQAMTFEGDRTGLAVAAAIEASTASTRRVLVDSYSRYVVSDKFVFSPLARRDPEFRSEVRETTEMFRRLQRRGAGVVFTNPIGWLGTRLAARNPQEGAGDGRRGVRRWHQLQRSQLRLARLDGALRRLCHRRHYLALDFDAHLRRQGDRVPSQFSRARSCTR